MTSQGKVKLQVWLLIVIVFTLGGVTGAALDRLYLSKNRSGAAAEGGRRGRPNMVEEMRRDLNLTEQQVTAIRTIFEEARKESRKYFSDCPGLKEQRERTQALIHAQLTPEQRQRYDETRARREAEWKEREKDKEKERRSGER